jgi:hypothetical protein
VYLVDIHTAPYRRAQLVAHQTPSMEKERYNFLPHLWKEKKGERRTKKKKL